jgi:hypothetical protein
MSWLIDIAAFILAILLLIISHILDIKKSRLLFYGILIIIFVLFTGVYWGGAYHTAMEEDERKGTIDSLRVVTEELNEGQESLRVVIGELDEAQDSLIALTIEFSEGQDSLIKMLRPFKQIARVVYPNTNERQALSKLSELLPSLLINVKKIENQTKPCLSFLQDKTRVWRDTLTGELGTAYLFRPRVSVLRDIIIKIRFKNTIINADYKIGAGSAIVVESGSRIDVHDDSKELTFRTNELLPSNDIIILVSSKGALEIEKCDIEPSCEL